MERPVIRSGIISRSHLLPALLLLSLGGPASAESSRALLVMRCPGLPAMAGPHNGNATITSAGSMHRLNAIDVALTQGKQDYSLGISGAHYPLTSGQLTVSSGRVTVRFSGRYKDGTLVSGQLSQRSTAAGAIYLQGSAETSGPTKAAATCDGELTSSELRDIAQWVGERPAAVATDAPRAARAAPTTQSAAAPPTAQPQRTVAAAPKPVPVAPDASPQQRRAVAIGAAD
jgi:hypothetical protein